MFTENNLSNLMWSHYADSHKGLCIEYAPNTWRSQECIFPVSYVAEPLNYAEIKEENTILALLTSTLTKSMNWSYEKEWRYILNIFDSNNSFSERFTIRIPAFPKSVTIGSRFDQYLKSDKRDVAIKLLRFLYESEIPTFTTGSESKTFNLYLKEIDWGNYYYLLNDY